MKRTYMLPAALAAMLMLSSCARAPVKQPSAGEVPKPPAPSHIAMPPGFAPGARQDVTHVVGPGETLWRLSKMYDVSMESILRTNNLKGPRDLKMGARVRIPGAAALKPVIPLYRSLRWKYIIIHHSVTDDGNAYTLFNIHNQRGFAGLGYDFVIDNGTDFKADGQIEASPRWLKQLDGAHCKAGNMNHQGIGICLVGNFSRDRVSEKQMESLVYLVKTLQAYYHIPLSRVLGHGEVSGAHTECPGTRFPWNDFRRRMKE